MLQNVRIVLVNTSHAGNIGAAARAMKNMGLSQLYLVDPVEFPHRNATIRAAGADDILQNACVVGSLTDALIGCELVYGTSARLRSLQWPQCNARECAEHMMAAPERPSAIVFGRERTGLTNEELALCQRLVHIPTESDFSSLNLGAAVQVLAYELKMSTVEPAKPSVVHEVDLATSDQVEGFYTHIQAIMTRTHFLDPKQPKMLMQRVRRIFGRAELEKNEINILRGFLSSVDKFHGRP